MRNEIVENERYHLRQIVNSLQSLWAYLLRRWYLLLLAVFVGGVIGVSYAWVQKPKFQSYLSFALEDNGSSLGGTLSIAAELGLNFGGSGKDIFAGENILAILTSRRLVEDVLLTTDTVERKTITLADKYMMLTGMDKNLTNHPVVGTIRFPAGLPRHQFSYYQDSVLFSIYSDIVKAQLTASKPDRKLNIYTLQFTSPEQRYSKLFTERLLQQAVAFYTELRIKRSKQTLEVLESRVATMKGLSKQAMQKVAAISDANLNPAFASQSAQLQASSMDASVNGAAYGELFKNLEIARYQYLKEIPLLQVIDEARYPMRNLKIGRMKAGIYGAITMGILMVLVLITGFLFSNLNRQESNF
ncbi:hypothetical protein [Phnomibacter sp. MR]|uniref:hypothetical protein n=1 Tax=Phnomibacter sp. MR TaxID=3042318 RepID=UPI003A802830